jgi:hypothetical protein
MSEVSTKEARKGLATLDRDWFKYHTDQLQERDRHSWYAVCKQLKKFYNAASIVTQKWADDDTKNAYINVYNGL